MTPYDDQRIDQADVESTIRTFADNEALKRHRDELARFTAGIFADVGEKLHVVATSHRDSKSGYATNDVSDETTTVSILLRVAAQPVSACNDLFSDDRNYAAAPLLRHLARLCTLPSAILARTSLCPVFVRYKSPILAGYLPTLGDQTEPFSPSV